MGCANCGHVTFASVPTSPWTICTGSRQECGQAALRKLLFKGPRQGLAFPGKMTRVKTPGSGEAGQTPGWAHNHLISRACNNYSLKPHCPSFSLSNSTPLDNCCSLLLLDCAVGSCTGTLCSTGPAKIPRVQHLGRRQWEEPEEGLAPPKFSRLPEATLTRELVSSDLGKRQGSVDTSVCSQLPAAQ